MKHLLLNLLPNLHSRVHNLLPLVLAQVELLGPQTLGLVSQLRDRHQIEVRAQMPEEGRRDAHKRPLGDLLLAGGDHVDRLLVHHDLVESGLDQAARDVLELLAGLDEQVVALGDLDGDALPCVAGPDVQPGVAGAAVDGEEVEVGVEAG